MTPPTSQATVTTIRSTSFADVRSDVDLRDDPMNPEWVIDGDPRPRSRQWAVSADGTTSTHVWECSAGRFRWYFGSDEVVTITAGSVVVSPLSSAAAAGGAEVGTGVPTRLGVGDAAYFPAGTWALWQVDSMVRKTAVLRVPVVGPLARLVRGLGHRAHRLA